VLAEQTRDEVFEAGVRAQLELIEAALLKAAEADSDMVTEAAQHIIAAGGKRFRPLLVVLGSYLGPHAAADDVVKAAVVVELTHVASLYHDDVMDEAGMRRGSVSANSRWGNTVAILVGDLLFARASDSLNDCLQQFRELATDAARDLHNFIMHQRLRQHACRRIGNARDPEDFHSHVSRNNGFRNG